MSAGTLTVTGTDLEVTIRTTVEVEVMEEGRFVVPGRLITEAVRKMPPGAVTIGSANGEVEIVGKGPRLVFASLWSRTFRS